ncbi:hypothetical protein KZJ38_07400 [Paraburkholderia edwinii]|uniref:Uncharacterized protein n=1 Tax=Paraburkholderia edwinii TaxID=2861782 RepID=A0ABX8UNF3_9BURK|nr:hypothetical protein [Paraburkholderia edwinii]QYD70126.1 hypothetical protein KZJ38_07400 [Paraburkholderia edwinii]
MALRHRNARLTNYNAREIDEFGKDGALFNEKHLSDHPTGSADRYAIVVRSLAPVGGSRPGKRFIRRLNRVAREKGYPTWAAFMHALSVNRQLFSAIQKIATNIGQRKEVA